MFRAFDVFLLVAETHVSQRLKLQRISAVQTLCEQNQKQASNTLQTS